jgi:hypothetical protein
MYPRLVNCYNAIEECTAFISPTLQMGGGKKNTRGYFSLVIGEHIWTPLCTNFSFPKAAGEDTVNIYWKGSDFHINCRSLNTCVQGRISLFHVTFIRRRCWGSTARGIICLFPAILNGIHPMANSFI